MKKPKTISTLVTIVFLFSVLRPDLIWAQGEAPSGPPQKVFLAVLDLDLSPGIPQEAKTSLSDILREQLWKTGRFRVVDRNNMERIMKEQGFQLSDCTSKECAVKVGQLLGVEKMVTGNVTLLGKTYIISVQMTRVETGEIEKMSSDRCSACELDQLIGSIDKVSAALAEAVGGVAAPPKPAPAKPAKVAPVLGSLEVSSDPVEAQVYLDGGQAGVSPVVVKDIKPGDHRLLLKKEGYAPQEIMVSVKPGLNSMEARLKQLATIRVQGAPDGAQILIDGRSVGTTPREVMVPAGTHRVELSLVGYQGYSQDFEAREGESRTIGYSLQSLEKPREVARVSKPKPKGKGSTAKGFYYTGLTLLVGGMIGPAILKEDKIDGKYEFHKVHGESYALYGISGAGFLTATLSYIFMPPLSGRERAHLLGYSGIDIAATGLVLLGVFSLSARDAREKYEAEANQNLINMNKEIVVSYNRYVYASYGVIGFGAVLSLVSFLAAPAEKAPARAEGNLASPKLAISPEIVAYPEGGGYLGARAEF
ncbi:MAG: PEGA domain-containing protein [Proteobacteria bacterium]|nr:PEGA domain-containing protein [Pseudomonadota bacterium]